MTNTNTRITVFLNTWGNYNENGAEGGFWINLPCDIDETLEKLACNTEEEINEMEVFINDFETDFYNLEISEYTDIYELNELAEQLEQFDDEEIEKLKAIIEYNGGTLEDCIDCMDSYEFIEGETLSNYAAELVGEMGLPEFAEMYFDYEAFERDLSFDGYHETENGLLIG